MTLHLIRHGRTPGNALRRYIGRTDEPLSEEGALAAREARGRVPTPEILFVSPLLRARQTAQILFPGLPQRAVEDLREMDFGDFENRSPDEMAGDAAYRAWVEGMCEADCPGGEGKAAFSARTARAVADILAQAAGAEHIAIVAHGGTLMAAMSHFFPEAGDYYAWGVSNLGGYAVMFDLNWQIPLRYARL